MSLFMAGSTGSSNGNRTVSTRAIASIVFIGPTAAYVTGAGVS
jgi:hypothetical protein